MTKSIGRRSSGVAAGVLAAALVWPGSLDISAQQARASQPTPAGWVFSPSISAGETWDDNVLLANEGTPAITDFQTAISPRGALSFRGRRNTFQADYRGVFQIYQELTQLNTFDQRTNLFHNHRLTPTVTLFVRNGLSRSPTTDDIDELNVEFRRQGVLINDLRAGAETRLSRRSSLTAAYTFQFVDFDEDDRLAPGEQPLQGGHGHGAAAEYDYRLSPRWAVGAEYEMRNGIVGETDEFQVMNFMGVVGWRIDERLDFSGGLGYSRLATPDVEGARSAPAFRLGLSGSGARFAWNVGYRRSFLPSFGFGGTFDNQEFVASLLAPLNRRLDLTSSFSVRENDPLLEDPLREAQGLRSIRFRSALSYLATRWLRVEGYYALVHQDAQRAGGKVNRTRLGVQVVTSTRMRVR